MLEYIIPFGAGVSISAIAFTAFAKIKQKKPTTQSFFPSHQEIDELDNDKDALTNELEAIKTKFQNQTELTVEKISHAFNTGSELMEDMTISLGQIQEQVNSTSEPIETIHKHSVEATNMLTNSRDSMENLTNSIEHLNNISSLVNKLCEHMNQVNEKSQVIHNIANQANLLSLNAAIEAARAGEAGRGFGVVANDMNRLSDLSASSAQEISQILSGGLRDIETITSEMSQKIDIFTKASDTVCANFKSMRDVIISIDSVSKNLSLDSNNALENVKKVSEQTQTNMESLTKMLSDVTGTVSGNVIHDLGPREVQPKLQEYVIIDVRKPNEFNDELGHIDGATLYCLQDNFKDSISELDKEANYLFVCRSGGRSARGARVAQSLGFKHVTNMAGGMLEWRKNYPLAS